MEVILKEDYPGLGKKGQVVDVAKGYARNYLIPRNLALLNVAGNKSAVKAELQFDEIRQKKDKAAAEEIKGKIDGKELTVKAKVGKEGKLYGSVTKQDIVDLLKKDGFEIDKKILDIDDHIKEADSYDIQVNLFKDVKANIKLIVEGESEEEEEESDEEKKDIDTDEKEEQPSDKEEPAEPEEESSEEKEVEGS
jgi:large subunit ribosomal protein L9